MGNKEESVFVEIRAQETVQYYQQIELPKAQFITLNRMLRSDLLEEREKARGAISALIDRADVYDDDDFEIDHFEQDTSEQDEVS